MQQEAEVAGRAFRQYVTELAEQPAGDDEQRGEPMHGLRDRAVSRCRISQLHD
ncbi:MAG TPA: hypothetical protein VE396_13375 [Xanthobacteraceae bacterium]|jgi:hypothetical protein|nr:hypothetical protein [Xanthobacteraceae bacterium]